MAPKYTPNTEKHPAYNNHISLPDVLCSLISFKWRFVAANNWANHVPKTEMS